jgi:hypothetical protein
MVQTGAYLMPASKRFSVSLPLEDYKKLLAVARAAHPPLTLQYVLQLAVGDFLEKRAKEGRLIVRLGGLSELNKKDA